MQVFETNFNDYEILKCDPRYRVNVNKGSVINKHDRIITNRGPHTKYQQCLQKQLSHLIYEQVHGPIAEGMHIDHIDDNPLNNSISNLQLLTPSQNVKKSVPNRDYSFVKDMQKSKRSVKSKNLRTGQIDIYRSMYAAQQDLEINAGIIKMICDGTNRCKTGVSKKDNDNYSFSYTDELPTKKVTRELILHNNDEERKDAIIKTQQKCHQRDKQIKIICDCGKEIKKLSTFLHNKSKYHIERINFLSKEDNYLFLIQTD